MIKSLSSPPPPYFSYQNPINARLLELILARPRVLFDNQSKHLIDRNSPNHRNVLEDIRSESATVSIRNLEHTLLSARALGADDEVTSACCSVRMDVKDMIYERRKMFYIS